MDMKKGTTKHRTITDSHDGSNNKQQVNNKRTTALEQTAAWAILFGELQSATPLYVQWPMQDSL